MSRLIISILKFYSNYISPIFTQIFGNACRYTPTCSKYTIEALNKYGVKTGLIMGLKRLGRCHPWAGYGFDPVK